MDNMPSTKISNFSPTTIDEAVDREMLLVVTEPNVNNYQLPVKDIKERIAENINELEEAIEGLQPQGTDRQVMLGDGTSTPVEEEEEEEVNAPSSLFKKAVVGNAFDFLYGEIFGKGSKLGWEEFMNLIIDEIINRGIIEPPSGWNYIPTLNLAIRAPVNGEEQDLEAEALDENPNYTVGELVWEPSGIWNGTNEYAVMFSVIPNNGFFFIFPLPIQINGAAPDYAKGETDGSWTLGKNFPATMTANPTPNLSITIIPVYGANRPSDATINDNGYYSVAIDWSPAGDTFPSGVSTATFTLTASAGYRWNSNEVALNGTNYYGDLSDDGMTLTFEYQTQNIIQTEGTFTDARDGKVYPWKIMPDGKKWMTVNLDYAGNGGLYYDGASSPPFANAGRLYTWEQANAAAPAGWRLPSDAEWAALAIAAGGTGSYGEMGTAGTKLKAYHTWLSNLPTTPAGTDDYGFSALPGGYKNSSNAWAGVNQFGYWWTSSGDSSANAYFRYMSCNYENVGRGLNNKSNLFSVRCLQD